MYFSIPEARNSAYKITDGIEINILLSKWFLPTPQKSLFTLFTSYEVNLGFLKKEITVAFFSAAFGQAEYSWCYIFTWNLKVLSNLLGSKFLEDNKNRKKETLWSFQGSSQPQGDLSGRCNSENWRAWEEKHPASRQWEH